MKPFYPACEIGDQCVVHLKIHLPVWLQCLVYITCQMSVQLMTIMRKSAAGIMQLLMYCIHLVYVADTDIISEVAVKQ